MPYSLPEIAADVNAEEARASHRCVRAMHDGQCPYCLVILPAEDAVELDDDEADPPSDEDEEDDD